jgi:hypothetical protein
MLAVKRKVNKFRSNTQTFGQLKFVYVLCDIKKANNINKYVQYGNYDNDFVNFSQCTKPNGRPSVAC